MGVGEKEDEIRKQVQELGLQDAVRFLGSRSDVNELYQAMDVFVMPSLFEGIPVVGVEAQFADLPCFFSDKIPVEVDISEKTIFMKLHNSANDWAKQILKFKDVKRILAMEKSFQSLYNIKNSASVLENYYIELGT